MDTKEIRVSNLKRWVELHGTPTKEASYFSQLLSGNSSFGERSARRLEQEYKMGAGYLDAADAEVARPQPGAVSQALKLACETAQELRLLSIYRLADQDQRKLIDLQVAEVESLLDLRFRGQG